MLAQAHQKYVVCNADEGDSGTFADRMMMEGGPFNLIEGMTIAAIATEATRGYIYLRSEYPQAFATLKAAIAAAEKAGFLGSNVMGSGHAFHLEVRLGAGAYICGEETSLLESLEGKRGIVRAKPPIPALKGFLGQPTLVNNVMTFTAVPYILEHGPLARHAGNPARRQRQAGRPHRVRLRHHPARNHRGFRGRHAERPVRAVQVGGPLGAYFPDHLLDTPLDYEAMAANKGLVGHGGIVVFDDTVDMARQARFASSPTSATRRKPRPI